MAQGNRRLSRRSKLAKTHVKNGNHLLPEDLLTDDDIKKIAQATDNPLDKALIFVLYESGCPIGEILKLLLKHTLAGVARIMTRIQGHLLQSAAGS